MTIRSTPGENIEVLPTGMNSGNLNDNVVHIMLIDIEDMPWVTDFVARSLKRVVINQRDEYGNTALHLATWNCSKGAFEYLLENNADPVIAVTHGFCQ